MGKKISWLNNVILGFLFSGVLIGSSLASDLNGWNTLGNANWRQSNGIIEASSGSGFLVSKRLYRDFELKLEFRSGKNTNSGVFIRCSNPQEVSDSSCYEVNIFDHRPDPSGRTGGIVNLASPKLSINTEEKWNSYEISAHAGHLTVRLNGVVTVDTLDDRLKEGPIALQLASGKIEFRNISIRSGRDLARDIVGVWDLKSFSLDDGNGNVEPWCEGSFGSILYFQNYMSVSINCISQPGKKVFYSGPYEVNGATVVHKVKNYGDEKLHRVFRRKIEMLDVNHLDLVGPFGDKGKVIVSWKRRDSSR